MEFWIRTERDNVFRDATDDAIVAIVRDEVNDSLELRDAIEVAAQRPIPTALSILADRLGAFPVRETTQSRLPTWVLVTIDVLGRRPDRQFVDLIASLINLDSSFTDSPPADVPGAAASTAAVMSLAEGGHDEAIPGLLSIVHSHHREAHLRPRAAALLHHRFEDQRGVDHLAAGLSGSDPETFEEASASIVMAGLSSSLIHHPLTALELQTDPNHLAALISLLSGFKTDQDRIIDALIPFLDDRRRASVGHGSRATGQLQDFACHAISQLSYLRKTNRRIALPGLRWFVRMRVRRLLRTRAR